MAAGCKYNLKPIEVEKELCNQQTIYRMIGGFNLVDPSISEGVYVPHTTPLAVDFKTRKAVVCKNVRVIEAVAADGLIVKVSKGHLAFIGMTLGTGTKGATISAIDKSNSAYDEITVAAAFTEAVKAGAVLFEAGAAGGTTQKNTATHLNYARVKVENGATITAMGQVYEIKEALLPCPVSKKDKESLGARFMFI